MCNFIGGSTVLIMLKLVIVNVIPLWYCLSGAVKTAIVFENMPFVMHRRVLLQIC